MDARSIKAHYEMPHVKRHTLKEIIIAILHGEHETFVTKALDDVSVFANQGKCMALIGRNGCGTSTLLKVIAEILKPGPVVDLYLELMQKECLANISKEELEEEQRQNKLVENDRIYDEEASYLAGIISGDIPNQNGPTKTLVASTAWGLEFHIRIHAHLEKPLVARFDILNRENLRMFGKNTKNISGDQMPILQDPGSYKIRFSNE